MEEKRLGKFYAPQESVESGEIFPLLKELEFVPWRAEFLAYLKEFEYIGCSPLFKVIEIGEKIPLYRMIIHKSEDGSIKVEAEIVG